MYEVALRYLFSLSQPRSHQSIGTLGQELIRLCFKLVRPPLLLSPRPSPIPRMLSHVANPLAVSSKLVLSAHSQGTISYLTRRIVGNQTVGNQTVGNLSCRDVLPVRLYTTSTPPSTPLLLLGHVPRLLPLSISIFLAFWAFAILST